MRRAIVLVSLLATAAPARADDSAKLAAGEIIVEPVEHPGTLPGAKVRAVIEAPPEAVWRVIDDCGNYKENLVRLVESAEISRMGNEKRAIVQCKTVLDVPWPMNDLVAYTKAVHLAQDGVYSRKWKLEKGDFTVNEGSWTLTAFDAERKRTLVLYETHAVPTSSVPDFLVEGAQKRGLPDLMIKLRASVARVNAGK
jgi:hypothetical protein